MECEIQSCRYRNEINNETSIRITVEAGFYSMYNYFLSSVGLMWQQGKYEYFGY